MAYQTNASGGICIADIQSKQIRGEQYHQLAPAFPPGVSIPQDEIKRISDGEKVCLIRNKQVDAAMFE